MKRPGPKLVEWLLSFAATMLIGREMMTLSAGRQLQGGVRYYLETSGHAWMHTVALAANALILLSVLVGIFFARGWPVARRVMLALSALGAVLVWAELLMVLHPAVGALYTLPDLPFAPLCNFGLVGAQVFGSYLLWQIPFAKTPAWAAPVARLLLILCLGLAQASLWDVLSRR